MLVAPMGKTLIFFDQSNDALFAFHGPGKLFKTKMPVRVSGSGGSSCICVLLCFAVFCLVIIAMLENTLFCSSVVENHANKTAISTDRVK